VGVFSSRSGAPTDRAATNHNRNEGHYRKNDYGWRRDTSRSGKTLSG